MADTTTQSEFRQQFSADLRETPDSEAIVLSEGAPSPEREAELREELADLRQKLDQDQHDLKRGSILLSICVVISALFALGSPMEGPLDFVSVLWPVGIIGFVEISKWLDDLGVVIPGYFIIGTPFVLLLLMFVAIVAFFGFLAMLAIPTIIGCLVRLYRLQESVDAAERRKAEVESELAGSA